MHPHANECCGAAYSEEEEWGIQWISTEHEGHIQSQSPVNVVMLNSKGENKTSKDKRNHIVHIRVRNIVGSGDSEEREEKERRHGSDRHRNSLGEPPCEDPSEHAEHVLARRRSIIELDKEDDSEAQEGTEESEDVFECED